MVGEVTVFPDVRAGVVEVEVMIVGEGVLLEMVVLLPGDVEPPYSVAEMYAPSTTTIAATNASVLRLTIHEDLQNARGEKI